jgi:hypothetical protein
VLGDPDGVIEVVGHLCRKGHDEMTPQGLGDSRQGVNAVAGASAFLQSRDHRLRRTHTLGERPLRQAGLDAEVVDQLTKLEVGIDLGGLGCGRLRQPALYIFPT